jgi:hypothetical protein
MSFIEPADAQIVAETILKTGTERSLPYPHLFGRAPAYGVFCYRSLLGLNQIGPPYLHVFVDATTGALINSEPISLSDLNVILPVVDPSSSFQPVGRKKGETISAHDWPAVIDGFRANEYILACSFWAGVTLPQSEKQRAQSLVDLWPKVAESGFMPVYRALAKDWFAWLEMP